VVLFNFGPPCTLQLKIVNEAFVNQSINQIVRGNETHIARPI